MAQVSRAFRQLILQSLPDSVRTRLLDRRPNWRKAMPPGHKLIFNEYLGDIRAHIDTRYKVERIMWTGVYERELMSFIERYVPRGATCLDVGGNVGAVTLALARRVGSTGRVHTFEPAPPNFHRLRANLELNPELAKVVQTHHCGCSHQAGELYWREEPGNPGNGFLGSEGSLKVEVVALDDFFSKEGLERLDFCKVDVEGMELEVFMGAHGLLRDHKPILFFETLRRFRRAGGRDNFGQLRQFLGDLGYEIYRCRSGTQWNPVGNGSPGDSTVAVHRSQRAF